MEFRIWCNSEHKYVAAFEQNDFEIIHRFLSPGGDVVIVTISREDHSSGPMLVNWPPPIRKFNVELATPWKDVNGVMLFDNDIVELDDDRGVKIYVLCEYAVHRRRMDSGFECDILGFAFKKVDYPSFPIISNYAGKHDISMMKIVGNKNENPDILIKQAITAPNDERSIATDAPSV
jgi:hypothetical protein